MDILDFGCSDMNDTETSRIPTNCPETSGQQQEEKRKGGVFFVVIIVQHPQEDKRVNSTKRCNFERFGYK
jgi:hypothetical protein